MQLHKLTEQCQIDRNNTKKLEANLQQAKDETANLQPLDSAAENLVSSLVAKNAAVEQNLVRSLKAKNEAELALHTEKTTLTAQLQAQRKQSELLHAREKAADQASARLEQQHANAVQAATQLATATDEYRVKRDEACIGIKELEARASTATEELKVLQHQTREQEELTAEVKSRMAEMTLEAEAKQVDHERQVQLFREEQAGHTTQLEALAAKITEHEHEGLAAERGTGAEQRVTEPKHFLLLQQRHLMTCSLPPFTTMTPNS